MAYKDPEKQKSANRTWRKANPKKWSGYTKKWRKENPIKFREYRRRWAKENPEKIKNARLKCAYGLTLTDYRNLLKHQKGRCAICNSIMESNQINLFVDHDKKSGIIRGLLCHFCNTGLGFFRDNPKFLKSAIKYLIKKSKNG